MYRTGEPVIVGAMLPPDLRVFVEGKSLPHILLKVPIGYEVGPLLHAMCSQLYPDPSVRADNVLFWDGLQARGIEFVREKVKSFVFRKAVQHRPQDTPWKLVLLLHADMLTWEAQCALRRVLESNVRSTRFVWVVEDLDRILEPIRSRCWRTEIHPDPPELPPLNSPDSEPMRRLIHGCRGNHRRQKELWEEARSVPEESRATWLRSALLLPPAGFWERWMHESRGYEAAWQELQGLRVPWLYAVEDLMRTVDPDSLSPHRRALLRQTYEDALRGITPSLGAALLCNAWWAEEVEEEKACGPSPDKQVAA